LDLLRHRAAMVWRMAALGLPLEPAKFRVGAMRRALPVALRTCDPGIVIFEYALLAQYLPFVCDRPRVLCDHEAGSQGMAASSLLGARNARYVRRYYPLASAVFALTEADREVIGREVPATPVLLRKPALAAPRERSRPEDAGPVLAFLGNFSHRPNREAAVEAAEVVLPRIRAAVPDARLIVAGAEATDDILRLRGLPGIEVRGFVEDLGALFSEVRLLLAPIRSGRGVRIKALSALGAGIPVVTTPLGAAGLEAFRDPSLHVAESPEDLARAAVGFLKDRSLTRAASLDATRSFTESYSVAVSASEHLDALQRILEGQVR
jgi:glycosyltransferase involved in cell wall biosynthesis